MMQRKSLSLAIIIILSTLLLVSVSIPSCSANYANWGIIWEGSSFHNGTHINMPFADVYINITRTTSVIYVSMDSEFHIDTNTTQNATLAFVYPSISGERFLSEASDTNGNPSMHIYANDTLYDYTVFNYDDVVANGYPVDFVTYPFIHSDTEFAVFNIELIANTTMTLSTVSNVNYITNLDLFEYYYIVGSARTFEGHTMERVHFHVVEEVPFSRVSFYPNESLSVIENNKITDATWEFNVTEFSYDTVGFHGYYEPLQAILIQTLSGIGIVAFIIIIVYQFGYKKSKQLNH
jgi:hypothetical protein